MNHTFSEDDSKYNQQPTGSLNQTHCRSVKRSADLVLRSFITPRRPRDHTLKSADLSQKSRTRLLCLNFQNNILENPMMNRDSTSRKWLYLVLIYYKKSRRKRFQRSDGKSQVVQNPFLFILFTYNLSSSLLEQHLILFNVSLFTVLFVFLMLVCVKIIIIIIIEFGFCFVLYFPSYRIKIISQIVSGKLYASAGHVWSR